MIAQSGMVLREIPKTKKPATIIQKVIKKELKILTANPGLIISGTRNSPEAKTMALGGVATGKQKAYDAAMTAGIINRSGFWPKTVARELRMGMVILIVAMFEANSVAQMTMVVIQKITRMIGKFESSSKASPIAEES